MKSGVTIGVGSTQSESSDISEWFRSNAEGYINKSAGSFTLRDHLRLLVGKVTARDLLKVFIVHGHDDTAKMELKNYLQNTLHLPEPLILHELPSSGRTIMEKFEEASRRANLVFIVLTPDDKGSKVGETMVERRRARQNVIFEMGYYLGKLGRHSGRVILLHRGEIELPSDISGLVYISIDNGIEAAGEQIRKEVENLLDSILNPQI